MVSVSADASRRTASALSAYMATASDFGVRQGMSTSAGMKRYGTSSSAWTAGSLSVMSLIALAVGGQLS